MWYWSGWVPQLNAAYSSCSKSCARHCRCCRVGMYISMFPNVSKIHAYSLLFREKGRDWGANFVFPALTSEKKKTRSKSKLLITKNKRFHFFDFLILLDWNGGGGLSSGVLKLTVFENVPKTQVVFKIASIHF